MKKTLILMLALLLMIFSFTACDSDDDASAAEVLQEALNKGGDITLSEDVTGLTSSLVVPKGVTVKLNLNGKTIESSADEVVALKVEGGTLTIEGEGTVKAKYTAVTVCDEGTLVVNGGSFISTGNSGIKVGSTPRDEKEKALPGTPGTLTFNKGDVTAQEFGICVYDASKVVVSGGTFTTKDNAVIGTNGTATQGDSKTGWGGWNITVNGGTFNGNITSSGYIACGIYMANEGKVTLAGGTFNIDGGVGVLVRRGTLVLETGTVNLTNTKNLTEGKIGDSTVKVKSGMEIVADNHSKYLDGYPAVTTTNNKTGYIVKDVNGDKWTAKTGD